MSEKTGLLHIYCGDGKGKTTCAFGLVMRCLGCGYRVRVAQFLKSGETGEVTLLKQQPNAELLRAKQCGKFTFQMNEQEKAEARKSHTAMLEQAFENVDGIRLLVLDEIMAACTTGMVEEARLIALLNSRPPELEVVLTGRNPSKTLLSMADYVTEMTKHKHPYDRGIAARHGIER